MVNRTQKLSKSDDLFLFGARGTGKSTLLREIFDSDQVLWIDLLTEKDEEFFGKHPDELSRVLKANLYQFVVIDEIQKFPKLLDIVHHEIENNKKRPYFILTGSSARKLKRDHSNLLGGRAITFQLFPFTWSELGQSFDLKQALETGTLPPVWERKSSEKKVEFLRSYIRNYLNEEILVEQFIRQIAPFKDFLEVAAQMNGQILNFSKIARDVGVSDQTVKSFFQILEDTLIGFSLPSFHRSIRKRQRESPKFYFFDLGVKRALARELTVPLLAKSTEFGNAFEHFIILEIQRVCDYLKNDYRLSYLRTKDDAEVDLVIERPGKPDFLLEIKSTHQINEDDIKTLSRFKSAWDKPTECATWSLDPHAKVVLGVDCFYWQDGFSRLFE